MNTLAIDTGTETLNIGLSTDKDYRENRRKIGLRHAEQLMPLIASLLDEAGLSAAELELIVCASGPGSFTGLRIGMSTAKGLALGSKTPLVSIPTLDAFGHSASFFDGAAIPVIDARKNRYYTAVYIGGERKTDYLDLPSDDLIALASTYSRSLILGPDCGQFADLAETHDTLLVEDAMSRSPVPSLVTLGELQLAGAGSDEPDAGPLYLRRSEAEIGIKTRDKHE